MYKKCIIRNCKNKPIKSHSIQKALLKRIASEGHVFSIFYKGNAGYSFKRIGINNATTSPLFCKEHDDNIFKSVEKSNDFEKFNSQEFDILTYRNYAFFCDKKEIEWKNQTKMLTSDKLCELQNISKSEMVVNIMTSPEISRMLALFKETHEFHINESESLYTKISAEMQSDFIHHRIIVPRNLGIVCTTVADPYIDWDGETVRDIRSEKEIYPPLFITILSGDESSIILFSYHNKCKNYDRFISKLNNLETKKKSYVINKMLYNDSLNLHISPHIYSTKIEPNLEQINYWLSESEGRFMLDTLLNTKTPDFDFDESLTLIFEL